MGRGRAKGALATCLIVVAAIVATGCGESHKPNDPRASGPTRISVNVTKRGAIVQPTEVAMGEEPTQQIPQNQNHPQPDIKTKRPLDVVFVIANQTGHPTTLAIHGGSGTQITNRVLARSSGSFQTQLATGSYTVTARGVEATPAKLAVGPYRASSQNNVLLP
jgi:hypothetical protein